MRERIAVRCDSCLRVFRIAADCTDALCPWCGDITDDVEKAHENVTRQHTSTPFRDKG